MQRGNKRVTISATERVQYLWEKGTFKSAQAFSAIDEQLAKSGYNFSTAELGMALLRAPYLTRKGKRGGYTYIQKGPYVKNDVK